MIDIKEFQAKSAAWIDAHAEDIVRDLQALAQIPSASRADLAEPGAPFGPDCRKILDYALDYAAKNGFETENYDYYCGAAYMGDKDNDIAIISHLDVVPEGSDWRWPPYSAHREGDYLFGRGVDDNKGPAIACLYVMKMLKEMEIPLKHGVRLFFGCSEETGMQDMLYYREHYKLPKFTLVPDGAFPVNYAQKGSLNANITRELGGQIVEFKGGEVPNMVPPHATALVKLDAAKLADAVSGMEGVEVAPEGELARVNASGMAAHASTPEHGKNAFAILADALIASGMLEGESLAAMQAVKAVALDIHGEAYDIACEDPDTGKTTMCIGVASTEGGKITLTVDCRLSIACDQKQVGEALTAAAAKNGFVTTDLHTTEPVYVPKDDPKVQALQKLYFDMTGDPAEPYSMGGGTYARVFGQALTFGPGGSPISKDKRPEWLAPGHGGAHAPDEYLYIPGLLELAKIYACAILLLDELL